MKRFKKSKGDKGQSLVELLVALALIVIIIVAVVGLSALSIKAAYFAKRQTMAKRYVEEAMEWLRAYKRDNWYNILNYRADTNLNNIDFCLNSLNFDSPGSCSSYSLGGVFKRELMLYKYDLGVGQKPKIKATVVVTWSDSAGNHITKVESIFSLTE
ncbi:MAG: hypothetical protein KatS3mg088_606 [Patescibacteria group bacterium]|nr:MAG: hypothetical protein KatS3mg088_606 [Patescibacteria group bacterium]